MQLLASDMKQRKMDVRRNPDMRGSTCHCPLNGEYLVLFYVRSWFVEVGSLISPLED